MSQTQFFCLFSGVYLAPHISHGWALVAAAFCLVIAFCTFFAGRK